jgi:CubicO group peptidase (beta-lactamase class C family)
MSPTDPCHKTAGFGYEFFNTKLRNYGRPVGFDVFSGDPTEVLRMPLVNQPGSRWEYGINIDWAGIALERQTGQSLNDYMQEHIFQPLGIHNTNMFPTKEMKSNLACMHQRWPGSQKAIERDHVYRRPLIAEGKEEQSRILNSGGAGLYSRPTEYIKVLAVLLNDGTCPTTKKQILKPETVKHMFENQITQMPDFGRRGIPDAKPEHSNPLGDLYPQGEAAQVCCLCATALYRPLTDSDDRVGVLVPC